MQTSEEHRAFWRRMATRYQEILTTVTDERKRQEWLKRIAEAEERAGITPILSQP